MIRITKIIARQLFQEIIKYVINIGRNKIKRALTLVLPQNTIKVKKKEQTIR